MEKEEALKLPIGLYNRAMLRVDPDAKLCGHCGRRKSFTCICPEAQAEWQRVIDEVREVSEMNARNEYEIQKPVPLSDDQIDIDKIKSSCQKWIDFVDSDDYHEDNDADHYVFEAAIEAVFGKGVWDWVNKKMK